jgi:serine/threonine protein kinase
VLGRDIKGANILVGPTGDIKLADFGVAKHVCGFSYFLQEVLFCAYVQKGH